jgi:hypothetical protein
LVFQRQRPPSSRRRPGNDDPRIDLEGLGEAFHRVVERGAEEGAVLEVHVTVDVDLLRLLEALEVPVSVVGDVRAELAKPGDVSPHVEEEPRLEAAVVVPREEPHFGVEVVADLREPEPDAALVLLVLATQVQRVLSPLETRRIGPRGVAAEVKGSPIPSFPSNP